MFVDERGVGRRFCGYGVFGPSLANMRKVFDRCWVFVRVDGD